MAPSLVQHPYLKFHSNREHEVPCEAVPLRKSVPFRSKLGLLLGLRR